MPRSITRRDFVSKTARFAATAGVVGAVISPQRASPQVVSDATGPVTLSLIGCGRRGMQLIDAVLRSGRMIVTMVCDVDAQRMTAAAERIFNATGQQPAMTSQYEDALNDPAIEGVILATPDHWHMIQLLKACAAHKDVYLEPPVALTIIETKAASYATRKYHRVVQVGLQHRSAPAFDEAIKIVRGGKLGRITQTRLWHAAKSDAVAPKPDADAPPDLDWDRWLGPAPQHAFNPTRYQQFAHWWDYGHGEFGYDGIHLQDLMQWATRTTAPKSVVAVGGNYSLHDFRETPDTLEVLFECEGIAGPFMHVYSLRLSTTAPDLQLAASHGIGPRCLQIIGGKGTLVTDSLRTYFAAAGISSRRAAEAARPSVAPPSDDDAASSSTHTQPADTSTRADAATTAHLEDFATCVRSRNEPRCPIEAGTIATIPIMLTRIAYRLGRKLHYDGRSETFYLPPDFKKPDDEANALRNRPYRAPYGIPVV